MRELEEQFRDELVVVGVHSGKFITERETARIADAAKRLGVDHPVVNDRQFRVWRSYAVRAWPTIVVIDPRGYVLGQHAGEFTADAVASALREIIAGAGDTLV
ncbi:MAG: alkyl hydroperoxide reductase, partial [Gemmatimonadaceae bacterium]|nr:alkyl hydroperoxide reductase [Gemmatimonadaceae bacterium]